jgi:hypothetical protein
VSPEAHRGDSFVPDPRWRPAAPIRSVRFANTLDSSHGRCPAVNGGHATDKTTNKAIFSDPMRYLLRTTGTALLALLMTAGVAVGQTNNSDVTQEGAGNNVDVTQEYVTNGVTGENTFTVSQNGDNNDVGLFEQVGAGNEATITQVGDGNTVAENPQQGFTETGSPNSYDGKITVDQYGNNNDVYDVDQQGYNNVAEVDQGGEQNDVNGNLVDIDGQTNGISGATGNTVDINQTTNGNAVGTGNSSVRGVRQVGQRNELTITQEGDAGSRVGTELSGMYNGKNAIVQDGADNVATVSQRAGGNHTVKYLIQTGNSNELMIDQFGGSGNTAAAVQLNGNNMADITQNGSNNTATVTQQ